MTVATVTADVRSIPDDGLLALYLADDDAARRAALAEAARRDRADQAAREREQVRAAWFDAAYSDYLAAEAECRGELVNRAGVAAGIRDGFQLWSGPRHFAYAYATEELADWWAANGRLTIGEYRRQHAAGMREARLEALEQDTPAVDDYAGAWDTEDTTEDTAICMTREDTEDEHDTEDREDRDRDAAVDGPAQAGLRHLGTADTLRPGRDGQQPADAQAGQVRHAGPVQPAGLGVTLARRQASQRPAPVTPQTAAAPPVRPAAATRTVFTVAVAANGHGRILVRAAPALAFARAVCEATPEAAALAAAGQPLQWTRRDAVTWQAGNRAIGFTILGRQAVRDAA